MNSDISFTPNAATGTKLGAEITDKRGFGERWRFSTRMVDNLLAAGLPHCKVGPRRVRIIISEGDAWMRQKYSVQRRGRPKAMQATPSTQAPEAA